MGRAHRTNNISEEWNNDCFSLVGHRRHPVWICVDGFKKDDAMGDDVVIDHEHGQVAEGSEADTNEFQDRVRIMFSEYERGGRDMGTFTRGVARAMAAFLSTFGRCFECGINWLWRGGVSSRDREI